MIKSVISSLARELGIEEFGFSSNSFTALFPYYKKDEGGNISLYARGKDYHKVVYKILYPIKQRFEELGSENAVLHCDNGIYDDRKAAFEAGLGFYGKNNMLINDKYGSFFFIGQVIHNLNIEPDKPLEKECLNCGNCIKHCVTGVLKNGFEEDKCLSAITQKKGELTKEEIALIVKGGLCWGCDACQLVCPHNKALKDTFITDFLQERIASLKLSDFEGISEREFKRRYKDYAFSWRGGRVIKRNLEILENNGSRPKYNEEK